MTDFTEGQVLDALITAGIVDRKRDSSNALTTHFRITGKEVAVATEMHGMGHNEPRSYGIVRTESYDLEKLMAGDYDD